MNLLFTTLLSCILDSCHTGPFLFFFIAAVPCHDVGASYFIPPCHWFPSPPNSAWVSQTSLDLTDGWRKTCLFLFMFLHDSRCSWTSLCVCLSFYFFLFIYLFIYFSANSCFLSGLCRIGFLLISGSLLSWFSFLVRCLLWHWVPCPVAPQCLLCRSVTR